MDADRLSPRARAVHEDLLSGLAEGKWSVGERMPPTRELTKSYKVGLNTVRQAMAALAARGYVELKDRSGAYVTGIPETPSGALTLGVLVPSYEYFANALDGLESVTAPAGARLMTACSQYDPKLELEQFHHLLAAGVDGLFLVPTNLRILMSEEAQVDDPLLSPPVPTVYMDRMPDLPDTAPFSAVVSDHRAGVRMSVRHLIEQGRTRIGYIGGVMDQSQRYVGPTGMGLIRPAVESLLGYQEAMAEADLTPLDQEIDLRLQEQRDLRTADYTSLCAALDLDAIFFHRESDAAAAQRRLLDDGVRVPDDVAMMATCELDVPTLVPLSGVILPRYQIGRMAARTLLDQLRHPDEFAVCQAIYRPELVIRDSCGASGGTWRQATRPAKDDSSHADAESTALA